MMVQTEIGLLPEDWEVVRLEKVGSFSKGSGISRDEGQTGNIPAVRYGELYTDHDNYIKTFKSFISPEIAMTSRKMKTGCVLFTASGETKEDIGKAVAFLDDCEAYAGGDLIILNPKADYCSLYLGYTLNSPTSRKQRAMVAQGDSVVHITTGAIKDTVIPLPSTLTEQQNIASALSSIDKLIEVLGRTISKKRLIREGAMEELLSGKKRLPGFTEEWVEKTIEELFKTHSTASLSRNEMLGGDVFCIHYGDIHTKYGSIVYLDSDDIPSISKEQAGRYTRLKDGDIIMADASEDYAGIGKSIAVITCGKDAIAGLHTILLRPKTDDLFDHKFTSYILSQRYAKQQIEYLSEGTKINSISFNKIKEVTMKYPSDIKEQQAIADILTSMDDEISVLQSEKEKYELIRSGMMEELLTGAKRLK